MIEAFRVEPTREKQQEIIKFLTSYWKNDVWKVDDSFFDELRPLKWSSTTKSVNFSTFPLLQRDEVKFMIASRLQNQEIQLSTVFAYGPAIKRLGIFLNTYYPGALSIVDLPYDKAEIQWRTFLIEGGAKVNCKYVNSVYQVVFNQLYSFFVNFYDTREETEKDIWDVRKIPGTRITENKSVYLLNFTKIPIPFRSLAKRYLKFRVTIVSHSQGSTDLVSLRLFFGFLHERYPTWNDLINLTEKTWRPIYFGIEHTLKAGKNSTINISLDLDTFLEYIQRAQYPEAPELPSLLLLFKEDLPRRPQRTENDIKYIPDGVLQQLEDHLEHIYPC